MEDWMGGCCNWNDEIKMPQAARRLDPEIYILKPCLPEASEDMKPGSSLLTPASIVTLIKRGYQRRIVCWRQTQSRLIAIRRRGKTFIHLIWNVQTLVETWDAFSIAARAWEHMERCKLSDPPDLACAGAVFALTPVLNCFSIELAFLVVFICSQLALKTHFCVSVCLRKMHSFFFSSLYWKLNICQYFVPLEESEESEFLT